MTYRLLSSPYSPFPDLPPSTKCCSSLKIPLEAEVTAPDEHCSIMFCGSQKKWAIKCKIDETLESFEIIKCIVVVVETILPWMEFNQNPKGDWKFKRNGINPTMSIIKVGWALVLAVWRWTGYPKHHNRNPIHNSKTHQQLINRIKETHKLGCESPAPNSNNKTQSLGGGVQK